MKLLMLIKTTGLEYDDRLRKEAESLQKLGARVTIVVVESANRAERKTLNGGIGALSLHLRSRNWFRRAQGLTVKTLEMYLYFLVEVVRQRPDIVWLHNLELGGLVPVLALLRKISYIDQLVWDHHELPPDRTLENHRSMATLIRLMNLCDKIVMANEERRAWMLQAYGERLQTDIDVLNNYADQLFLDFPRRDLPETVDKWLVGSQYILAQGGASPERRLLELIGAVYDHLSAKLIVIGPYEQSHIDELDRRYGQQWRDRVLFTGYVPQLDIPIYLDHAVASAVFYTTSLTNSRLCAANRLYQAVARCIPVVVGYNPPMKNLVNQYGCGVVVNHDDPASIAQGIEKILASPDVYRNAAATCAPYLTWERQLPILKSVVS